MANIGRPKKPLIVTDEERSALIRLTKRACVNRSLAFRARLVLACADGLANERFFGLLTEKALRRGSHTSVPQLRAAILAYVAAHNEKGKPFKWTKSADEILDKMRRFALRTQQVHAR
jgi:hypothetical protein